MCAGLWKEIDSKQAEIERAQGDHVRIVYAAPQQPAQSAEQDERAAFEAAYNAGWDASDACDNAYNNGTSEQLSVPGQSHEPEVFQRWRAEWFSNRDEVITQLLSTRAASTQSTATQPAQTQVALTRDAVQQKAIDHGFTYWRASDAHGVTGTNAQAVELLQNLLGVEVEIVAQCDKRQP